MYNPMFCEANPDKPQPKGHLLGTNPDRPRLKPVLAGPIPTDRDSSPLFED